MLLTLRTSYVTLPSLEKSTSRVRTTRNDSQANPFSVKKKSKRGINNIITAKSNLVLNNDSSVADMKGSTHEVFLKSVDIKNNEDQQDEDVNRTKLLPELDVGSEKQFVTITDGILSGRITGDRDDSEDQTGDDIEPKMLKKKVKRTLKPRKLSKTKLTRSISKQRRSKSPSRP